MNSHPSALESASARRVNHSARRVNALAERLGAKNYLEIGVQRGKTFFAVDIPNKVAVDPNFRFDVEAHKSPGVSFHSMTSDNWFLRGHADKQIFDIIFLDGLHTFEQTFRDFCNSLAVSHEKTVWVIDDTCPTDVYSACPDQRVAVGTRKKDFNIESGVWHGDVYKIVFAIHDFFPMFSYRTIESADNSQTIVWRQPRRPFSPVFNNLEKISRLTYFDFQAHSSVLQRAPEDVTLDDAVAGVTSGGGRKQG